MKKSIYLLLFETLSTIGSGIFTFTCSFYILQQTGSGALFGSYLALLAVVNTVSMPIIGNWIDRHSNKSILLGGQLLSIFSLGVFAVFYHNTMIAIFLLMMVLVIVDVIVKTIVSSNLKWIAGAHMERVVSVRQFIQSASILVSPIIGGILIAMLSIQQVALINVFTELCALIFIFLLSFKQGRRIEERQTFWQDFKVGVRYIYRMTEIKYLILFSLFLNFIVNALIVGMPILIIQKLALTSQHLGWAESMLGFALVASGVIFTVKPIQTHLKKAYILAFILQTVVFALLTLILATPTPVAIVYGTILVCQWLLGFSVTLGNIPYQIMLQHLVDEHLKSRVFSVNQSVVSAFVPLSYLLFGTLLPSYFITTLMGCIIAMLILIFLFIKKMGVGPYEVET